MKKPESLTPLSFQDLVTLTDNDLVKWYGMGLSMALIPSQHGGTALVWVNQSTKTGPHIQKICYTGAEKMLGLTQPSTQSCSKNAKDTESPSISNTESNVSYLSKKGMESTSTEIELSTILNNLDLRFARLMNDLSSDYLDMSEELESRFRNLLRKTDR